MSPFDEDYGDDLMGVADAVQAEIRSFDPPVFRAHSDEAISNAEALLASLRERRIRRETEALDFALWELEITPGGEA